MSEVKLKAADGLTNSFKDEVRATWRRRGSSGSVVDPISGKKMVMRKLTRDVTFEIRTSLTTTEPRSKKENWIVLSPADGSMTPVIQIEMAAMGNLRSSVKNG